MFTDILQPTHLIFILVVALLVLGPKRLPEVAKSLGNGLRDFRSAISGESDERPGQTGHYTLGEEPQSGGRDAGDMAPWLADETPTTAGSETTATPASGTATAPSDHHDAAPVHDAQPVEDARPDHDAQPAANTAPAQYPAPAQRTETQPAPSVAPPRGADTEATEVHQFAPVTKPASEKSATGDGAEAPTPDPSGTPPA